MYNYSKLLPVLLLGSAISGCSLGGGDFFNKNGSFGQQSNCHDTCGTSSYQTAQSHQAPQGHISQTYSQPAATNVTPSYQTHTSQSTYQAQPTYQAQTTYQPQNTGHQAVYGAAPYVRGQRGSSKGLRQSYTYGTLGATLYDVDSDVFGIQGRVGWQSASYYGAEVEGSFGVNDDDQRFDFGTGTVDAKSGVDTQIAAFAVGRYPVSDKFNVLGRVGYHNTDIDVEFDDGTTVLEDSFSDDGLAYGVGAEYAFDRKTSLRADYTIYDLDGANADSVSLAVARKF